MFLLSLVTGTAAFYFVLRNRALGEAEERARILLSTALAVRNYTDHHILPIITQLPRNDFFEESVPSFAAQTVFRQLGGEAGLYTYREPALNPTSIGDRPSPLEVELIRRFRDSQNLVELAGVRDIGMERLYYVARPIRITDPACLICHDTPDRAPAAMLARYGRDNGFGWRLNEVVGIQLLTVPVAEEFSGMVGLVASLAGGLLLVFGICYAALSTTLDTTLVRPLKALAHAADQASLSGSHVVTPPRGGVLELCRLAEAIERLRCSVVKAMERLSDTDLPRDRGGSAE